MTTSAMGTPGTGFLRLLLPDAGDRSFLLAALAPTDRAAEAWERWIAAAGGLGRALRAGGTERYKALLPLIGANLEGVPLSRDDRNLLAAARLREEARYESYRAVLDHALSALATEGLEPIVLRGAAIAELAWPRPALRHSGALKLMLPEVDLVAARSGLARTGFSRGTSGQLRHASGLALVLCDKPLPAPHSIATVTELLEGHRALRSRGAELRSMSVTDSFAAICCRAAAGDPTRSLLWVCDAAFLLRHEDGIDPALFAARVSRSGLGPAVATLLVYLREAVAVALPAGILAGIRPTVDWSQDELAMSLLAARRARGTRTVLASASNWRERMWWLRGLAAPPRGVLRRIEGVPSGSPASLLYVRRWMRWVARRG